MFLKTDGAGNLSFSSDLPTTSFTGATVETSIADSDLVLIYDDSATAVRKMTKANLVAGIGASAGQVIQVVSTTKTDTFAGTASGGSFVDVTGLSVSITPSSASNKILVMATVCGCCAVNSPSPQNSIGFKIIRGATDIAIGDSASSRTRMGVAYADPSGDARNITTINLQHLDSPATTSSTTYKIAVTQNYSSGGNTMLINRNDGDGNDYSSQRTVSSITVMEIKG